MAVPWLLRRTKPEAYQPQPLPRASTFRRVDKMTEPFPLVLPDSPVESDRCSISSKSPSIAPELRRRSPTYNDLRSLAAKHKDIVLRRVDSPLLPSPVIREKHIQSDSYFTFRNPRPRSAAYKSYEDLHILSHYCDGPSDGFSQNEIEDVVIPDNLSEDSLVLEGHEAGSICENGVSAFGDDKQRKDTYCSDESGWLANDTTCTERERKFRARCTQIVQSPDQEVDVKNSQIVSRPQVRHILILTEFR